MSYQPEERYWTDYLRIALPVVGLLLMLGLFWFWAASLIGDEDDDDPNNLAAISTATVAPSPSPSPAPTTEAAGDQSGEETQPAGDGGEETQPADGTEGDAAEDEDPAAADADNAAAGDEDNADAEEPCDLDFCPDDSVTTNSPDVNFREDPSTDSEVITQLDEGTELIVRDEEPVEEGDNLFIPVEDLEGTPGWVASDFLEPA